MCNTITIELCAEDRARLDRLAEALEKRTCDKCVATAIEFVKTATEEKREPEAKAEEAAPPGDEKPTVTDQPRKVERGELRAKVIELSAKGFKAQTRDIVQAYAPTVASVPEDMIAECYDKLVALEG